MKKHFIFIGLIFLVLNFQAQEKDGIKKTIQDFFQGMESNDTTMIRSTLHPFCKLNTIVKNKNEDSMLIEESVQEFFKAVINAKDFKAKEELVRFDIKIDGMMAMAWTPYNFYINDKFSHCGVNLFTLVKIDDIWKITAITDTRRKEACN